MDNEDIYDLFGQRALEKQEGAGFNLTCVDMRLDVVYLHDPADP